MPVTNPGRGKLKPHLRKLRSGIWAVLYRDKRGDLFWAGEVSFMTRSSTAAMAAKEWAASRNARIVANRGYR